MQFYLAANGVRASASHSVFAIVSECYAEFGWPNKRMLRLVGYSRTCNDQAWQVAMTELEADRILESGLLFAKSNRRS